LIGQPALFTEEFKLVIMIAVADRRDAWVGPRVPTRMDYERAYGWKRHFNESEMALFSKCMLQMCSKIA